MLGLSVGCVRIGTSLRRPEACSYVVASSSTRAASSSAFDLTHLRLGTIDETARKGSEFAKSVKGEVRPGAGMKGEDAPRAKVSEAQVRDMRGTPCSRRDVPLRWGEPST